MAQSETFNSDCLEAMRRLPSSSASYVITSPPYNLGEGMENKGGLRIGHKDSKWKASSIQNGYSSHSDAMPYGDYVRWQKEVLAECWRLIDDAGAIFYNHKPRIVQGILRTPIQLIGDLPLRQIIIWNRKSGFNFLPAAYMPACEWILLIAKPDFRLRDRSASGVSDVWEIPPETSTEHPAPFPYELPRRILQTVAYSEKPVFDPFTGSGTTRIAAHDLGFNFIGSELDFGYWKAQEKRFANHISQPNLFVAEQPKATQSILFETV